MSAPSHPNVFRKGLVDAAAGGVTRPTGTGMSGE